MTETTVRSADEMLDSPLEPRKLDTLSALLARDPRELSDELLDKLITAVRAEYATWEAEEEAARQTGRRVKHKTGLTLGDLDLDMDEVTA